MVQLENEYGAYRFLGNDPGRNSQEHYAFLEKVARDNNVNEYLVTSDNYFDLLNTGYTPNALKTINLAHTYFSENRTWEDMIFWETNELQALENQQPGRPAMVMEYWTGWYEHWGDQEHGRRGSRPHLHCL